MPQLTVPPPSLPCRAETGSLFGAEAEILRQLSERLNRRFDRFENQREHANQSTAIWRMPSLLFSSRSIEEKRPADSSPPISGVLRSHCTMTQSFPPAASKCA
eukprot:5427828-Amphidinium_carterae.1